MGFVHGNHPLVTHRAVRAGPMVTFNAITFYSARTVPNSLIYHSWLRMKGQLEYMEYPDRGTITHYNSENRES